MGMTVEISNEIEKSLAREWPDVRRRALEAIALAGYRDGALSRGQIAEMLGLNFWESEAFLKEHGAYLDLDTEDFEEDLAASHRAEVLA
jgi:predicted HTH domain antitoxin